VFQDIYWTADRFLFDDGARSDPVEKDWDYVMVDSGDRWLFADYDRLRFHWNMEIDRMMIWGQAYFVEE
jgi:hypothetical protein